MKPALKKLYALVTILMCCFAFSTVNAQAKSPVSQTKAYDDAVQCTAFYKFLSEMVFHTGKRHKETLNRYQPWLKYSAKQSANKGLSLDDDIVKSAAMIKSNFLQAKGVRTAVAKAMQPISERCEPLFELVKNYKAPAPTPNFVEEKKSRYELAIQCATISKWYATMGKTSPNTYAHTIPFEKYSKYLVFAKSENPSKSTQNILNDIDAEKENWINMSLINTRQRGFHSALLDAKCSDAHKHWARTKP